MNKNKEVDSYIEKATEVLQPILKSLRGLIQETVPNAEEQYKWSRPVYATNKPFCYLVSSKKYVTLGFNNYTNIKDPNNLLEGSGKLMRHIKIKTIDDIKPELYKQMIKDSIIL